MGISQPERIANLIVADYLGQGQIGPGGQLPSVRELKERYATTNTTICAALALLESQGRVQRQQGRGTFVTQPPPATTGPLTPLLGLVLHAPDATPSMSNQITSGVERAARGAGYQLLLGLTNENYDEERQAVARLRAAGCAGLVVVPTVRRPEQLAADYLNEQLDYPIVLADMAFPEQQRSQVLIDNYHAGAEVTRWLLAEGHQRIAFMDWRTLEGGEILSRSVRERRRGYLGALAAAGLQPAPADHWRITFPSAGGNVISEACDYLQGWARATPETRPTALIAFNDSWAAVLINFLRDWGVEIPRQLRIVGFDNCPVQAQFRPAFPTTAPDFVRLGEMAVELLLQQLRGELTAPVHYLLPAPLLVRGQNIAEG